MEVELLPMRDFGAVTLDWNVLSRCQTVEWLRPLSCRHFRPFIKTFQNSAVVVAVVFARLQRGERGGGAQGTWQVEAIGLS